MKDRNNIGISVGDEVFVLGFPLGIRGTTQNFAITRKGIIARLDDELLNDHYFLIDASAYPGNSGGPVVNVSESQSLQGTKAVNQTRLIGVVSAGIPYQDIAISQQTRRARIVFEEQTGLVKVVPVDSIVEAIDIFMKNNQAQPPEKSIEAPKPLTEFASCTSQ